MWQQSGTLLLNIMSDIVLFCTNLGDKQGTGARATMSYSAGRGGRGGGPDRGRGGGVRSQIYHCQTSLQACSVLLCYNILNLLYL